MCEFKRKIIYVSASFFFLIQTTDQSVLITDYARLTFTDQQI